MKSRHFVHAFLALLISACATSRHRQDCEVQPPASPSSLLFAVIGDSGTGRTAQYQIAQRMEVCRSLFPFDTVLMLGDNLYEDQEETRRDYETRFELPYKRLLQVGARFYA